jgi:hypothetical protein
MRYRFVFAASILLSLISTVALAGPQDPPVTYTTLDPPNATAAIVETVSANGTIAGYYFPSGSQQQQSFVISPTGTYRFYQIPFGYSTQVYAVNNVGSTTGDYFSQGGLAHEYARAGNGRVDYFDPPRARTTFTSPGGINDFDELTGGHMDSNFVHHGFVANLFGTLTVFDVPGATSTTGETINNTGVVAGIYFGTANNAYHAFVRDQLGNITPFDAPGAGTTNAQGTSVQRINSTGQIAGYYADSSTVFHGFLRSPDGTFAIFDAPDAAQTSGLGTIATGINSAGQVVGYYLDSSELVHGFFRDQYGNITEFDDPDAGGTGAFEGTYAFGISNTGVIVGYYYDSNNLAHAYKRQ